MTTNAITLTRGVTDIEAIGEHLEKSGLFGCSQKGQGFVLAMTCIQQNITPLEFGSTYHIIEGKVSMRSDAMLAKFVERGGRYKITERTATRAAATFLCGENNYPAEYTMKDAEAAGICFKSDGKTLKTNWAKYPKQMLWARLTSDTVRALDPGVCAGIYTPEEIQDFDGAASTSKVVVADPIIKPLAKVDQAPAPEPEVKSEAETPEVVSADYSKMPIGRLAGTSWTEFTDKQLETVCKADHVAITENHKAAAKLVLEGRKAGQ